MSEALANCPFCGSDRIVILPPTCRPSDPYNPDDRLFPLARCRGCFANVWGKDEDYHGSTAIAAWNTRAPDPRIAAAKALAESPGWDSVAYARAGADAGSYRSSELSVLLAARSALLEALEAGDA